MEFSDFALDERLLQAVADAGYVEPTPIQEDAIPPALERRDVLGAAMTGSGKTAAYLLPTLNRLLPLPRGTTRALVLAPTRELAQQVEQALAGFAVHTDVSSAVIHGGVAYEPQEKAFRRGVDVIIATPGRLIDLMRRPYVRLDEVEVLILDEADRMLDMGFIPDVRKILARLPAERQTLMFSATMPAPIVALSREILHDPATINIERKALPATGITQAVYPVRHERKFALFLHLLVHGGIGSALAFVRTKERADHLAGYLEKAGISVAAIHGDRTQIQRTKALEAFRRGEYQALVATDVAARGLDLVDLTHVVNIDVPAQPEDYIHRVGRTARYEATGDAFTFVAARELADLHLIEKVIGTKIPRLYAEGFDYRPAADRMEASARVLAPAAAEVRAEREPAEREPDAPDSGPAPEPRPRRERKRREPEAERAPARREPDEEREPERREPDEEPEPARLAVLAGDGGEEAAEIDEAKPAPRRRRSAGTAGTRAAAPRRRAEAEPEPEEAAAVAAIPAEAVAADHDIDDEDEPVAASGAGEPEPPESGDEREAGRDRPRRRRRGRRRGKDDSAAAAATAGAQDEESPEMSESAAGQPAGDPESEIVDEIQPPWADHKVTSRVKVGRKGGPETERRPPKRSGKPRAGSVRPWWEQPTRESEGEAAGGAVSAAEALDEIYDFEGDELYVEPEPQPTFEEPRPAAAAPREAGDAGRRGSRRRRRRRGRGEAAAPPERRPAERRSAEPSREPSREPNREPSRQPGRERDRGREGDRNRPRDRERDRGGRGGDRDRAARGRDRAPEPAARAERAAPAAERSERSPAPAAVRAERAAAPAAARAQAPAPSAETRRFGELRGRRAEADRLTSGAPPWPADFGGSAAAAAPVPAASGREVPRRDEPRREPRRDEPRREARREGPRRDESRREDARGRDARGGDARSGNSRGGDARGEDARGEDARGGSLRGDEARGDEARGDDARSDDARRPAAAATRPAPAAPPAGPPADPVVARFAELRARRAADRLVGPLPSDVGLTAGEGGARGGDDERERGGGDRQGRGRSDRGRDRGRQRRRGRRGGRGRS